MSNQSEEHKPEENTTATQPQRVSKRATVAAFYERMLPGSRRTRRSVQSTDEPTTTTESAEPTVTAEDPTTEATPPAERAVGTRSEMEWNDLISHRIEEAMRNGAFDNLRNKGKPLPQDYNPHVPEDRRMANDLLKNNGLAPQWIGDRTFTLQQIDQFRAKVRDRATFHQKAWRAAPPEQQEQHQQAWTAQITEWQEEIRRLNRRIESVNFQQPSNSLEIFKLILDNELKRAGVGRALDN